MNNYNHSESSNKKKILCIAGMSGSGKTIASQYIQNHYGIRIIESYTDRFKREDNEVGHKFVTPEEYDKFKLEDMIAYTKFGNNRYCCLKDDVQDYNTYVIDETGIRYLKEHFSDEYDIKTLWIESSDKERYKRLEKEYGIFEAINRMDRDGARDFLPSKDYDYNILNDYAFDILIQELDNIVFDWLHNDYAEMVERWR